MKVQDDICLSFCVDCIFIVYSVVRINKQMTVFYIGLLKKLMYSLLKFLSKDYIALNPNLHSPLKLLNHHGMDGKTWFKKQGPLWVLGSGYKVELVSTFFPPFSDCTMSHVPHLSQY